jgi:hypothetical protein
MAVPVKPIIRVTSDPAAATSLIAVPVVATAPPIAAPKENKGRETDGGDPAVAASLITVPDECAFQPSVNQP